MTIDCVGLALDLESRAKTVESQTTERAMIAAANALRALATLADDARRLDHLQSRGATVEILPAGLSWKFRIGGLHSAVSHNIRAAIDAAAIRAKGGEAK